MDFFSWHAYRHTIEEYMDKTYSLHNCLQENGYTEVESICEDKGVYVCAAKNDTEQAIMVVTYHSGMVDGSTEITLTGLPKNGCQIEVYLTDEGYDERLERVFECDEETFVLPVRMVEEQIKLIKIGEK